MAKGTFITIEGPDGAGKSTQLQFIRDFFQKRNIDAIFTREPGGTNISEKIRNIILDKENLEMSIYTEALLYAAARAQLVEEVIHPALEEGKAVICDRFLDSSIAYQGYGRGLGHIVEELNAFAINGIYPDLTILLKVSPNISCKRRHESFKDRMELEKEAFHQKVYQGYLELEKKHPKRILGIDGTDTIESISEKINIALEKVLEKV